ncbi:MAG: nuclear transport factor 2 family protein [Acidobacteria bacterium]|nr:nuclear transport factor 2 family protein [Acidobacteriota bacterium]
MSATQNMREDVIRIVNTYIDAVSRNDASNLPLHPDVVFEGPLGRYEGIEAFVQGLADFVPVLNAIKVLHLTADHDTCAAVLEIDTIFGLIPFLEYFNLKDGKIASIRAYYDPRPVLEGLEKRAAS